MKYTEIGGKKTSKIILGGDYYGTIVEEKDVYRLVDTYVDFGGNHLDTANLYTDGQSETILGRWLKSHGRDKMFVSTKGAHPPIDNMSKSRLSSDEIRHDVEQSLSRMQLDYFDMYWLHRDDENIDAGEIVERLNIFIREGKMCNIGCSNWKSHRIAMANDYAEKHGLKGFSASQIKWSYVHSSEKYVDDPTLVEMNDKEYEFYKNSKIPVCAFASQAKGFLQKYDSLGIDGLDEKTRQRYLSDKNIEKYQFAKKICDNHNISLSTVCLLYLTLNKDIDTLPIVGCKTPEQLRNSLNGIDTVLSEDEMKDFR